MRKIFVFIFIFTVYISNALSSLPLPSNYHLGVGNITHFAGEIQIDEQGTKNYFELNPYFNGSINFNLPIQNLSISPSLGLTLPLDARDELITRFDIFFTPYLNYTWRNMSFGLGPGIALTYYLTDGGTQTLDNGTGYTDFFMPNGSSYTQNITFNISAKIKIAKIFQPKIETFIYNLWNDKRAFSYVISWEVQL
ncbi:MAG: hypothetical protein HOJ35_10845 [Bdellovibrionales bacterium]|jgi:hypothetical protein|nr:hypothetical protein [Bdellovibrionales bacterium]